MMNEVCLLGKLNDERLNSFKCFLSEKQLNITTSLFQENITPLVLQAQQLKNIDKQILKSTYDNNYPIVLSSPSTQEINTLLEILNEQGLQISSKEIIKTDIPKYSFYGIKKLTSGNTHELHIADLNLKNDSQENELSFNEELLSFISSDKNINGNILNFSTEKIQAFVATSIPENVDLIKKANAHMKDFFNTVNGKKVSTSFYCVACHVFEKNNFDDGDDWYCIIQDCVLDGSPNYDKTWQKQYQYIDGNKYWVGGGDVCHNYVGQYKFSNYLKNGDEIPVKEPSPQTTENKVSVTSGVNFSIGGNIGFEYSKDSKVSAGLSGGAMFISSKTIEIPDVEIINSSMSRNNSNAEWTYKFRRAYRDSAGRLQHLVDPAKAAYNTFTPRNIWLWKIPTTKRSTFFEFVSKVEVEVLTTVTRYSGSQEEMHVVRTPVGSNCVTNEISLPLPPLFGSDKNYITFESNRSVEDFTIISKGKWSAYTSDSWLELDKTGGIGGAAEKIIVQAQNNIGNKRAGKIFLRGISGDVLTNKLEIENDRQYCNLLTGRDKTTGRVDYVGLRDGIGTISSPLIVYKDKSLQEAQKFAFIPTEEDGYYYIAPKGSIRLLCSNYYSSKPGIEIVQYLDGYDTANDFFSNQLFKILPVDNNAFMIEYINPNFAIGIKNNSNDRSAYVNLQTKNIQSNYQKFVFEDADDGYKYIKNVESGLYLAIDSWLTSNNATLKQYVKQSNNDDNKLFKIVPTTDSHVRIQVKNSKKFLEFYKGEDPKYSFHIVQYENRINDFYKFRLERNTSPETLDNQRIFCKNTNLVLANNEELIKQTVDKSDCEIEIVQFGNI